MGVKLLKTNLRAKDVKLNLKTKSAGCGVSVMSGLGPAEGVSSDPPTTHITGGPEQVGKVLLHLPTLTHM